jgi:hypothetical protein
LNDPPRTVDRRQAGRRAVRGVRLVLQVRVVEDDAHAPAGALLPDQPLGDQDVVELLDRDVDRLGRAVDELENHLLQIVGSAEVVRADVPLDASPDEVHAAVNRSARRPPIPRSA